MTEQDLILVKSAVVNYIMSSSNFFEYASYFNNSEEDLIDYILSLPEDKFFVTNKCNKDSQLMKYVMGLDVSDFEFTGDGSVKTMGFDLDIFSDYDVSYGHIDIKRFRNIMVVH